MMIAGYAFMAGVVVGAAGYHLVRRKVRKTFTSAPDKAKKKAKGLIDSLMDSVFGNKGDKK